MEGAGVVIAFIVLLVGAVLVFAMTWLQVHTWTRLRHRFGRLLSALFLIAGVFALCVLGMSVAIDERSASAGMLWFTRIYLAVIASGISLLIGAFAIYARRSGERNAAPKADTFK